MKKTNINTSYLVSKIAQDDEKSFRILFQNYSKKIYFFALRILKSKEDAEGVIQNVFITLWENRKKLDPETSFDSFLFTVAKNNILNTIRKKGYHQSYIKSELLLSEKEIPNNYEFNEMEEIIKTAIDSLTPKRKAIFLMNRYEGKTYAEIAVHFNLSQKSIEYHMSEALRIIKNYLRKHSDLVISFIPFGMFFISFL